MTHPAFAHALATVLTSFLLPHIHRKISRKVGNIRVDVELLGDHANFDGYDHEGKHLGRIRILPNDLKSVDAIKPDIKIKLSHKD